MARMTDIYGRTAEFQPMWVLVSHNDNSENGQGAWNYLDSFYDLPDAKTVLRIKRNEHPETIFRIIRFLDE